MVSVLNSKASGPGLSPGWGHCVVFLGETLPQGLPLISLVSPDTFSLYCILQASHNEHCSVN